MTNGAHTSRIFGRKTAHELDYQCFCIDSRWKRLEEERVAEEERRKLRAEEAASCSVGSAERAQKLSYLESIAKRNQIFNMNEAFQMLSKELSEMMQRLVSHCASVFVSDFLC